MHLWKQELPFICTYSSEFCFLVTKMIVSYNAVKHQGRFCGRNLKCSLLKFLFLELLWKFSVLRAFFKKWKLTTFFLFFLKFSVWFSSETSWHSVTSDSQSRELFSGSKSGVCVETAWGSFFWKRTLVVCCMQQRSSAREEVSRSCPLCRLITHHFTLEQQRKSWQTASSELLTWVSPQREMMRIEKKSFEVGRKTWKCLSQVSMIIVIKQITRILKNTDNGVQM